MSITCNGRTFGPTDLMKFLGGLGMPKPRDNKLLEFDCLLEGTSTTGENLRCVLLTHPVSIRIGADLVAEHRKFVFPVQSETDAESNRSERWNCFDAQLDCQLRTNDQIGHWEYAGTRLSRDEIKRFLLGYYIYPPMGSGPIGVTSRTTTQNIFGREIIDKILLEQPLYWVIGDATMRAFREVVFHSEEEENMTPHDYGFMFSDGRNLYEAEGHDEGWYVMREMSRGQVMEFGDTQSNIDYDCGWYQADLQQERVRMMKCLATGYIVP